VTDPPDEADLVDALLDEASSRVSEGSSATRVPGLRVRKHTLATELEYTLLEPSVTATLSGSERLMIGDAELSIGRGEFFVSPVVIPAAGQIRPGRAGAPFVSLVMRLERVAVGDVVARMARDGVAAEPAGRAEKPGSRVGRLTEPLLLSMVKLTRLMDSAVDASVLGPLAQREVIYRVLCSDQGHLLLRLLRETRSDRPVMQAVRWLRDNAAQSLPIEELAALVGMSPSTLFRQFRELTGMAPLQYRNRLRLGEARRLMITESMSASAAAEKVGYRSAAQFSRDYRRLYGIPPYQHAHRAHPR
jgi:AraC-like DNA-binding protein